MSTTQQTISMEAIRRITLPVEGFGCGGGGALTVERALTSLSGVTRAYVNPATEMAYVEFDPTRCQPSNIASAVESAGFRILVLDRSPRGLERLVR